MESLIVFDYAEMIREQISRYCDKIEKPIIFPENIYSLQDIIKEGNKPLITEFNQLVFKNKETDIELLLSMIEYHNVPTIIYTNSNIYKEYIGGIENAKVHYIIEKSPFNFEMLKKGISGIIENPEYKETEIIGLKRNKVDLSKINNYNPVEERNKNYRKSAKRGFVPHPTNE